MVVQSDSGALAPYPGAGALPAATLLGSSITSRASVSTVPLPLAAWRLVIGVLSCTFKPLLANLYTK